MTDHGAHAGRLHRSMQKFVITGGRPLSGTVRIAGAKNGVLKMMAAAALTDQTVSLRNVPKISDVTILREVMTDIGFEVKRSNGDGLELRAVEATWPFVPLEAAARMRASFILLGPMLARFGHVILPNPGGDRIGRRPVDFHVMAMEALGATIEYRNGYYYASAPPAGLARRAHRVPDRQRHGHRERDPRGDPGARDDRDRQRGGRAGGRRPDRDAPRAWARGSSGRPSGGSRSRAFLR